MYFITMESVDTHLKKGAGRNKCINMTWIFTGSAIDLDALIPMFIKAFLQRFVWHYLVLAASLFVAGF